MRMLRNLLLITIVPLVGMLVVAYITTDPSQRDEPPAKAVLDLFDRVAFSGFGEAGPKGEGPYLRRWSGPVRIAVIGGPAEEDPEARPWADGVEAIAELYDQLPRLDVSVIADVPFAMEGDGTAQVAEALDQANLVVWSVPEPALEAFTSEMNLPREAASDVASYRNGCALIGAAPPVLSQVAIVMRAELSASKRRTCLGESLAMALGFNIEDKTIPDVFRAREGQLTFHPLGRMATALVYDEALEAGMPRERALEMAATILKSKGLE